MQKLTFKAGLPPQAVKKHDAAQPTALDFVSKHRGALKAKFHYATLLANQLAGIWPITHYLAR